MTAPGARLAAALLVVHAVTVGCGSPFDKIETRYAAMPGVAKVEAWREPGDGLPFIHVPVNLDVAMDAQASRADILEVAEASASDVEDGDVERLALSLRGPARATWVTGGGVSDEMVDDLLEARDDPGLSRYLAQESNLGRRMELTLASGDLDDVVAAVERYRQVEGVHLVSVRLDRFVLTVDDTVWEAELTRARIEFIRDVGERFRLRAADVGYPHRMTLLVHPAEVKEARRLLKPRSDLGHASVQAHRPAAQSEASSEGR